MLSILFIYYIVVSSEVYIVCTGTSLFTNLRNIILKAIRHVGIVSFTFIRIYGAISFDTAREGEMPPYL